MPEKCGCCEREREIVGVACIPGIPMSIAWCSECLQSGAIPYWAAVANTACCDGLDHTHEEWQDLVAITLKYHNKTMEQFLHDVEVDIKEMDKAGGQDGQPAVPQK